MTESLIELLPKVVLLEEYERKQLAMILIASTLGDMSRNDAISAIQKESNDG